MPTCCIIFQVCVKTAMPLRQLQVKTSTRQSKVCVKTPMRHRQVPVKLPARLRQVRVNAPLTLSQGQVKTPTRLRQVCIIQKKCLDERDWNIAAIVLAGTEQALYWRYLWPQSCAAVVSPQMSNFSSPNCLQEVKFNVQSQH